MKGRLVVLLADDAVLPGRGLAQDLKKLGLDAKVRRNELTVVGPVELIANVVALFKANGMLDAHVVASA